MVHKLSLGNLGRSSAHWGSGPRLAAVRRRAARVIRTPAFGIAVITPLVFAGAVGASPPSAHARPRRRSHTAGRRRLLPGPVRHVVVAVTKTPDAASTSRDRQHLRLRRPRSWSVRLAALRIPTIALTAYRNAERMMASAVPRLRHQLEPAGRHRAHRVDARQRRRHRRARHRGQPDLRARARRHAARQRGHRAERRRPAASSTPARWARCSSCPAPGRATPPTATATARPTCRTSSTRRLAAARYLCSGGLNLRDQSQVMTAILRYNNSMAYAQNVLGWAAAYATGVVPVDLPPITGPIPPIGDAHLEQLPRASAPACRSTRRAARQRSAGARAADQPGPHGRRQPDVRAAARTPAGVGAAGSHAARTGAEPAAGDGAAAAELPGVLPRHQPARRGAATLPPEALPPGIVPPPAGPPGSRRHRSHRPTRAAGRGRLSTGTGTRPGRTRGHGACARPARLTGDRASAAIGPRRRRLDSAVMSSNVAAELGSRRPHRAGQGDRPRAAQADHRARHGQERHRRRRRRRARRDLPDHLRVPEEDRDHRTRHRRPSPTCPAPARSRSAST